MHYVFKAVLELLIVHASNSWLPGIMGVHHYIRHGLGIKYLLKAHLLKARSLDNGSIGGSENFYHWDLVGGNWGHALQGNWDFWPFLSCAIPGCHEESDSAVPHVLHHDILPHYRSKATVLSEHRLKTLKPQAQINLLFFKLISLRYFVTATEKSLIQILFFTMSSKSGV